GKNPPRLCTKRAPPGAAFFFFLGSPPPPPFLRKIFMTHGLGVDLVYPILPLRSSICATPPPCLRGVCQVSRLLVFEGGDRVEAGGSFSGQSAERDADDHRGEKSDHRAPRRNGNLEAGKDAEAERKREADERADEPTREREEDRFREELHADLALGGAESLADADLLDAGLHVGQHGVHD